MSEGEAVPAILSRFRGIRRNGTGWVALCPAHADKIPSLSITVSNGKILLHCHASCSVEAVCSAAGIELRELFTDGGTTTGAVAEYSYSDESRRYSTKLSASSRNRFVNGGRTVVAAGSGI